MNCKRHANYNPFCPQCLTARQHELCQEHLKAHPNGCDCEPCVGCNAILASRVAH